MSNRNASPESDALATWRKGVDDSILRLQQRSPGANGLIVPGGGAGTWATMKLQSGWAALTSAYTPAYVMDADGFVHLRGLLSHATSWPAGSTIWTPPTGYAPRIEEFTATACQGAAVGVAHIDSHPTLGLLLSATSAAWGSSGWISLSGVSYYAGGQ